MNHLCHLQMIFMHGAVARTANKAPLVLLEPSGMILNKISRII